MTKNTLVSKIKTILGYGVRDESATMKDTQLVPKHTSMSTTSDIPLPTINPVDPADWDTVDRLVDENFRRWMYTGEEKEAASSSASLDTKKFKKDLHTVDAIHSKLERLKKHVHESERIGK